MAENGINPVKKSKYLIERYHGCSGNKLGTAWVWQGIFSTGCIIALEAPNNTNGQHIVIYKIINGSISPGTA